MSISSSPLRTYCVPGFVLAVFITGVLLNTQEKSRREELLSPFYKWQNWCVWKCSHLSGSHGWLEWNQSMNPSLPIHPCHLMPSPSPPYECSVLEESEFQKIPESGKVETSGWLLKPGAGWSREQALQSDPASLHGGWRGFLHVESQQKCDVRQEPKGQGSFPSVLIGGGSSQTIWPRLPECPFVLISWIAGGCGVLPGMPGRWADISRLQETVIEPSNQARWVWFKFRHCHLPAVHP